MESSSASSECVIFTVIVPTHRRAHLLFRALQSVKSQHQFQDEESAKVQIIVVSDVIDPATDLVCNQVLEANDIYLRRAGSAGPSQSRNHALQLAEGQYILFLDDDDALHSEWLMELSKNRVLKAGVPVYGNCTVVTERRLSDTTEFLGAQALDCAGKLDIWLHLKNQVHMSCYAFPRQCITHRRFDHFMRAYEDWEFLLGLYREFPACHVPSPASYVFEVHDATTDRRGSSSRATGIDAVLDYLYVYRRYPGPTDEIRRKRSELLARNGLAIPPAYL